MTTWYNADRVSQPGSTILTAWRADRQAQRVQNATPVSEIVPGTEMFDILTGTMPGVLPKNKTGDILCTAEGQPDRRIAIEIKFDKSVKFGDIQDKDIFTKKADTAWSQLLEAKVNRDSQVAIIVFDRALVDGSKADTMGETARLRIC